MDIKSKKNKTSSHAAWLLNEMAYAGRENLDSDHVTSYDKKEDAKANEELQILKEFGLNQKSVVVDFGAGTGQFTIAAASECNQVMGRRLQFRANRSREATRKLVLNNRIR